MMKRAWLKASVFTCCAALATACVVTTNDDPDDNPDDLSTGGTTSGAAGSTSTGGSSESTGGSTADAGSGSEVAGAAGETATGTCETAMPDACATCLSDADNGFATSDTTGVWDACNGVYPCCEESSRYVRCMQVAWSGDDVCETQGYGDDYTSCCVDQVAAGLEVGVEDLSAAFYGLTSDAFSEETEPSCFTACFFE